MGFFNRYTFIGLFSGVALTLALLVLAGYILYTRTMTGPEGMGAMLQPPEFPSDLSASVYDQSNGWGIRTLEGEEVPFSQFEGSVVFLNLWATWCGPCVSEMANIQNLYDQMKDEDVVFLLVSQEAGKTVRDFVEKGQFSFPVYLSGAKLPGAFLSRGIPATFIVDRNGGIAFKHLGPAKWDDKSCLSFIRGLM